MNGGSYVTKLRVSKGVVNLHITIITSDGELVMDAVL